VRSSRAAAEYELVDFLKTFIDSSSGREIERSARTISEARYGRISGSFIALHP
jgi:hypothetical protein